MSLFAADKLSPYMLLFWQLTSIGFCVALGVLVGLRVRRRGLKPWAWRSVPEAVTMQPEVANELLTQLHESTINSIDSVRQHTLNLQNANQELSNTAKSIGGNPANFCELIDAIVTDNGRLESELQNASSLIEHHASHIRCQLDGLLTDPVTVIPNRRAFEYELKRRFAEWLRNDVPFCVLIFDLDYFKDINDRYGHQVGDEVLRLIGHRFQDSLRQMDLPARYGGDEFVAILPETKLHEASEVAERLRVAFEQEQFDIGEGRKVKLTVSIGVSEVDRSDRTAASLLRRSDKALYASKEAGRNRSHRHDQLESQLIED